MTLVVVTSNQPGEGKTGVAAAVARHLAYAGRPVQLARVAGEGNDALDAAYFASLPFAPGSLPEPAAPGAIASAGGDALTVIEAGLDSAASFVGANVVLVTRGAVPGTIPAGLNVKAVIVTAVPAAAPALPATVGDVPVIGLREDRTLAGFSVSEARALLNAEVLVQGDEPDPTCDTLVISPIASDAGQPYFRRFPEPAVVVRFDRTDMHLAAIRAQPRCLILTGGRRPSDYLFDAATASGVPVLLSRTDTENTVIALEAVFDHTRFQGQRKLDRMAEILDEALPWEALGA